jgi:lysyl-tRNA synthetase class 2
MKARENEKKKAAKAAAAPPKAQTKPKAAKEEELNPNQYYEIRSRQIKALLDSSDPNDNPYPHKFQADYDHSKFFEEFNHLKSGESDKSQKITVAGRIYGIRSSSSKLIFYDIRTSADTRHIGQHIQIVCQAQEATEGGVPFEKQHEVLRRGDVIGITGYPGRTAPKKQLEQGKQGELSIFATE